MALNVTSIRKILDLELKKGCQDRAVIGGLDSYLSRWGREAGDALAEPHRQMLAVSYAALDIEERSEWIRKMMGWLDEVEAGGRRLPVLEVKDDPSDLSVTTIKGISSSLAAKFSRLGVETVRDMLYFFPRRHLDYSKRKTIAELEVGEEQTVVATLWEAKQTVLGGRRSTEVIVGDESGNMRVVWFNQPYLAKQLRTNSQLVLSGRVSLFKGIKVFQSPEYEPLTQELVHTGRLVPLYPLTRGLSPRQVRRLVKETVDLWAPHLADFIPEEVRRRAQLLEISEAIRQAHYPESEQFKARARRRLAFDELFLIQLGVLSRRRNWRESGEANPIKIDRQVLESFLGSLPFTLTGAQRHALDEIIADMEKPKPMSRLLQGEVGSGKTVVAVATLLAAATAGYQGAFMAPTEILAEQHFSSISQLLANTCHEERAEGSVQTFSSYLPRPIKVALLTGSTKRSDKKELHKAILEGDVDIVIGTHALIQREVEFARLGLAIVDEQHRFGVMQRSALRQKGATPHLLVMTATPIPRSLALTLYGDLDLSVINELPPGRQVIKTKRLDPDERDRAYHFLRQQVEKGRQAFIICPLIEESEAIEAKAATREYERLSGEVFPDLRLGLLHGKLKASEKDEVMRQFRAGELDILVATPVVEVGIDVPNATVMLIEGADRFGLAQLHQFRGRVGRGEQQSYCILVAGAASPEAKERLSILERTQDGFLLAEEDLRLRGPGEFFGTRQSGLPDLRMAKLSDMTLLELARSEAIRLFKQAPDLSRPEYLLLRRELARLWPDGTSGVEA